MIFCQLGSFLGALGHKPRDSIVPKSNPHNTIAEMAKTVGTTERLQPMRELKKDLVLMTPSDRAAEKAALLRILIWSKEQVEEMGAMHSATYLEQSIKALMDDE